MISICPPAWLHPLFLHIQSLSFSCHVASNTAIWLEDMAEPSHSSVKVWLGQELQLDLP